MNGSHHGAWNRWPAGALLAAAWTALGTLTSLPAAAADGTAADAATPGAAASGEGLAEIVVMARKRAESLQDAPISITAFSGDDLEERGTDGLLEVAAFTPNLVVQNNPGNGSSTAAAAMYLRGVGQDDFAPTLEPGVGVYVDGIYLARTVGALLDIVDIERLEVLRGPQGTLFGRNTIGGALSITTRKPDSTFGGVGEVTFGNDQRVNARATLNVPLSETLFARVSLGSFNQDGYVRHVADGRDLGADDTLTGRAALRWVPSDRFELNLSVDGTRDRESGAPYVITSIQTDNMNSFVTLNNVLATGDPFSCYTPAQLNNPACYNQRYLQGRDQVAGTFEQFSDLDLWGASLTADIDAGAVKFKSISSYRDMQSEFARDADGSDLLIAHLLDRLVQHQFSEELQALGTGFDGRLSWITGLYYFEEGGNNPNRVEFRPVIVKSGGAYGTRSWAVFSQATYDVTKKLSFTLGLRYTDEQKEFTPDSVVLAVNVPPFILPLPPGTPVLPSTREKISANELTPLLSASFHWTPALMTYASYSEGFKSGGFTQRVFPPEPSLPRFNPEFVKVYEVGFKLAGASRRWRLNGAAFHTRYDDLQVLTANLTRVGPFIANAAQADIDGFELELAAIPADAWQVQLGAGYVDPQYKSIRSDALEITTDKHFRRISDWTLSGSLSRAFPLGGGTLTPRLDWSYRSDYFNDSTNTPELKTEGYHLVNVGLGWERNGLSFALDVQNVFDEQNLINGFLQPNFGLIESLYDRGRQWRAILRKRF
jgi:iron complex outermembrane recepter protein